MGKEIEATNAKMEANQAKIEAKMEANQAEVKAEIKSIHDKMDQILAAINRDWAYIPTQRQQQSNEQEW